MATTAETAKHEQQSNVQMTVAIVFGAVLALVGILAPIVAGASNEFLYFGRNYLHDGIHLLSGVAGLVAGVAAGGAYARAYNKLLGVVYLLVTVLGFAFLEVIEGFIALNAADNLLHLALALAFLAVGYGLSDTA